jgi:NAD(P)-dependent dehydrogenase (short-subunit alcohol dehydrogenase family)
LFDVSGRRIVITGGTRGLGAVIAAGLAAAGARVAVVGRSGTDGDRVVSGIRAAGGDALAVQADITDPLGPANVIAATVAAFGGVDVLVNNAGITEWLPVRSMNRESYQRVHGLNAEAALFM